MQWARPEISFLKPLAMVCRDEWDKVEDGAGDGYGDGDGDGGPVCSY